MKKKENKTLTSTWSEIKDEFFGKRGTKRRDELERNVEAFRVGLLLKKIREEKKLTQAELGEKIHKKREYISRIENNPSNLTLKTLYEIVEKGLGGRIRIKIES
jgi:DNA-binding XRE family transcriptional regulator